MKQTLWSKPRPRLLFLVATLLAVALGVVVTTVAVDEVAPADHYAGTNFYQPISSECPYYSAWTTDCYVSTRPQLQRAMEFMAEHDGGDFHRVWISLDQLFSCFDATTGFCGYDQQALANVADTLRIMAGLHQKADLVLFAQPNRNSDVHYFHVEALDGEHPLMRANYIEAAVQFVRYIADDPVAASAVQVVDMQNEGYFQNRRDLRSLDTSCGSSGSCIDREFSKPFFTELYAALHEAAPQFAYTVSAVREILGEHMEYWLSMYPVDVYDVHLYITDPEQHRPLFAAAEKLPKPWFSGETGTTNTDDPSAPCYTYDGDDPCTAATAVWWRQHLGPDYGAEAVLVEHYGAVVADVGRGPALTRTGKELADLS
jgi:hypothetical protein